ncbi:hypothetical protein [Marinobacter oulmenensis]|uniref:Uncharacterized protein n=1 Tax=Marinobacter oulmenensis TaxID=643747 RepID=A0A840UJ88_9GAMM|nr:hypothetical protein [Marinobacter oulmenensis]MBB5321196.1 hypothetical protein [Marinobacter oulmenensis]
MSQENLFDDGTPLTTDMHVILQLFTNYRGIDIRRDFEGLCHVYHSVHTHPDKLPKTSWSPARVLKAVQKCQAAGLVTYPETDTGHKYEITAKGIEARRTAYLTQLGRC